MADKAAKKQRGRPFPKGVSGNPHGCARGSRHKASLLAERLMEGDVEEVVRAVVTAAKNGDTTVTQSQAKERYPIPEGPLLCIIFRDTKHGYIIRSYVFWTTAAPTMDGQGFGA